MWTMDEEDIRKKRWRKKGWRKRREGGGEGRGRRKGLEEGRRTVCRWRK